MSFLDAVEKYLKDAAGGPGQKRAALAAAKDVAQAPGEIGDSLRRAFWAWLSAGKWLQALDRPIEWRLPNESMLSESAIRENYPHTSYKEALAEATAAWEARVARCVGALAAGWPVEECLCFVCTQEELREAMRRAGRVAA